MKYNTYQVKLRCLGTRPGLCRYIFIVRNRMMQAKGKYGKMAHSTATADNTAAMCKMERRKSGACGVGMNLNI